MQTGDTNTSLTCSLGDYSDQNVSYEINIHAFQHLRFVLMETHFSLNEKNTLELFYSLTLVYVHHSIQESPKQNIRDQAAKESTSK